MTQVYVALYEHRHGSDTRVFANAAKAQAWKEGLAYEWWKYELDSRPMPTDPAAVADAYFEFMADRGEFFTVAEVTIE